MEYTDVNEKQNVTSTILCLSPDYKLINLKQKHKDELLLSIYEHDGISHSELAETIGVSPSGLNAIIKKICEDCEPQTSPLEFTKVNKFKYYRLTDSGKRYVETNLISVEGREYERKMYEYWEIYQARIGNNLENNINNILEQYTNLEDILDENQNLIYSFMECLLEFYSKMPQSALSILERLVKNGKIRDQIKTIIHDKYEELKQLEPLTKMVVENPEIAYHLADFVQDHITGCSNENILEFEQKYEWEILKSIIQKIEADMFRAMMNFKDKQYIKKLWLSNGMDMHLAYYLAEKYAFLLLKHEQDRERKERIDDRNRENLNMAKKY